MNSTITHFPDKGVGIAVAVGPCMALIGNKQGFSTTYGTR